MFDQGEEEGSDLSMFSTDRREYVAVIEEYLFMLLSEILLEHTGGGCGNVFPPPVTGSALHSKKHNMLVPAKSSFPANFCVQYTSPKLMQLIKDNKWYLAGIKSMF